MQDTKRFETNIRRRGLGWSGALGYLHKGGEEEQGGSKGLLEALHAGMGMGTGIGKQNAVGLRGG
jgi:hypothetical protein